VETVLLIVLSTIEPKKVVMTTTTSITMDVQALVKLNVVMVLLQEAKNVISVPTMPTLLTDANSLAESHDAVMDSRTSMKNVIMPLPVNLLQHAETTVNSPTVEMKSLIVFMEKNVTLDLLETQILPLLDALPDVPSTLVEPSAPPLLVILTELWPVPDVSILMLDLPLDPPAVDLFNGWSLNPSKRSLNSKLTNSKTSLELESEEANVETANSPILILPDNANVSLQWVMLLPPSVLLALQSPESQLSKPHSMFSTATALKLPSSNNLSLHWSPFWSENHSSFLHITVVQPMLIALLLVRLKPSMPED